MGPSGVEEEAREGNKGRGGDGGTGGMRGNNRKYATGGVAEGGEGRGMGEEGKTTSKNLMIIGHDKFKSN